MFLRFLPPVSKRGDLLDIISEILETDRLAEEKLEKARAERIRLLDECEKQLAKIREESEREIEDYKNKKLTESENDSGERSAKLREDEKAKIAAFEALFEKNHAQWEQDIFKRVLQESMQSKTF